MTAATTVSGLIDRLLVAAEQRRDRLVEVTAKAVQIPSPSGDEGAVADFFEAECRRLGLEIDAWSPDSEQLRHHPAYVPVSYDYSGRKNVVAIRRGGHQHGFRKLILHGHLDTAPVDPHTRWQHDPFGGEVCDGRIYGRGAADMKGGCAVALVALEILDELDVPLAGDVAAHFVLDGEAGGNGTLAAVLRGHYGPHAGCIMLEPTRPDVMLISGRGAQFFRISVVGEEGGTEYHRDLHSAIDAAIVLYQAVKRYAQRRDAGVNDPLYERFRRSRMPTAIGTLHAGTWPSTVPGQAVLEGTIECLPGEHIHTVVNQFERFLREEAADDPWLRDHPFSFERFGLWFEAAGLRPDHPFVRLLCQAGQRVLGREPFIGGGGGSDLRLPVLYARCPTVLWGPAGGPFHAVDEWVAIDDLLQMLKVVLVAAVYLCHAPINGSLEISSAEMHSW